VSNDAALGLLVQIPINSAGQQYGYTAACVVKIRLKYDPPIMKLYSKRSSSPDSANLLVSAVWPTYALQFC